MPDLLGPRLENVVEIIFMVSIMRENRELRSVFCRLLGLEERKELLSRQGRVQLDSGGRCPDRPSEWASLETERESSA